VPDGAHRFFVFFCYFWDVSATFAASLVVGLLVI
jgi:hypothetical protein